MPPPAVFLLGLLFDLLGCLPVGDGVLTLLLVHGLCVRWGRFLVRQGFVLGLAGFCRVRRRRGRA